MVPGADPAVEANFLFWNEPAKFKTALGAGDVLPIHALSQASEAKPGDKLYLRLEIAFNEPGVVALWMPSSPALPNAALTLDSFCHERAETEATCASSKRG